MSNSPQPAAGAPAALPAPQSPCINVCTIDRASRQCVGCARTIEEITDWSGMTPAEQSALLTVLEQRLAQRP